MKRYILVRNTFLSVIVTLLLLTVSVVPILAEDQKPAASTPAPAAAAPAPATETPAAAPAEDKPTGSLAVSALSKYVWRGYENTKDSIVVQPSMTVGYKGFSANVWGNLDTKP
jgi:hypothetical protein